MFISIRTLTKIKTFVNPIKDPLVRDDLPIIKIPPNFVDRIRKIKREISYSNTIAKKHLSIRSNKNASKNGQVIGQTKTN